MSDWSLMVDPLSYLLLQPVLHNWCNKGHGMCYPVCGMMHIKTLAANQKDRTYEQAMVGTCARNRRALQQLTVTVNRKM